MRRESKQEWICKILEGAMKELLKKSNLGTSGKKKKSIAHYKNWKHVSNHVIDNLGRWGVVDGWMNIGDASEIISINENCLYCILIFRD